MKKKWVIFSIFLAASILEMSLFPNLFFGRVAPDAFLILVVFLSIKKNFNETWKWVFLAGIISDIGNFQRIGISAISFLCISYGIGFLSRRFLTSQAMSLFLMALFLVLSASIFNLFLKNIFSLGAAGFWPEGKIWLGSFFSRELFAFKIINNLLAALILYWPFKKIDKFLTSGGPKLALK